MAELMESEAFMQSMMRRERAVQQAVQAADRIILEASDGSVEETNYLTGEIAHRFMEKVRIALTHALSRKEFVHGTRGESANDH